MSAPGPAADGPAPGGGPASAEAAPRPAGAPVPGEDGAQPRYEPPPSLGRLLPWVLLFVVAAVAVVAGGVYFG
ncbi:hypothetical protein ACGFS9_24345 [Streptomyces sp. NPDC048566]|uniref:hypothetical protein n=1 Tax=Streptomyces sp. NPDC048566 TaxID=3365569 RepID=UPI003713441F